MDAWRFNSFGQPTDRRGGAILAGSVALHVLALTVLGFNLAGRYDGALPSTDAPLYLDMEPWPDLAHLGRRPPRADDTGSAERLASTPHPVATAQAPLDDPARHPVTAPGAASARPAPPQIVAETVSGDDAWRVRPVPGPIRPGASSRPWGGDVCRDLSNFAAWNAANWCERGPAQRAEAEGSPPAVEAGIGQRRLNASEQRREDGFASQAAANDAWRAYIRGEGDYPGLRSLFTQH